MMWVAANLLGSEYRDDILRVSLPIETFQSAREVTFEQQEGSISYLRVIAFLLSRFCF